MLLFLNRANRALIVPTTCALEAVEFNKLVQLAKYRKPFPVDEFRELLKRRVCSTLPAYFGFLISAKRGFTHCLISCRRRPSFDFMKHIEADFYSGYEGEDELVFTLVGPSSGSINVWNGFFDDVFEAIPPGPQGMWEGLLLPYHLLQGCWGFHEEEMIVEDLPLFAAQLAAIDVSRFRLQPKTGLFHEVLQALVHQAITDGGELRLSRF
ncbi:hypothetical protein LRS06_02545 [Hymenobacter sp. J193]|uniref:hypothetical protein n=1 Tax=Hymenobacter sp. J193 TaxID=2898429 RepID=UPI0021510FC3|nr:hypothetical protein [Hymenobacter sp. J193]MCR5886670.1 hypothetical protein [Hymenobacter sp. J193]